MSYLPLGCIRALQRSRRTRLEHRSCCHLFLGLVLSNGPIPQCTLDWYCAHKKHARLPGHLVGISFRKHFGPRAHRWCTHSRSRLCVGKRAWYSCTVPLDPNYNEREKNADSD
jgi:hypothetical protein